MAREPATRATKRRQRSTSPAGVSRDPAVASPLDASGFSRRALGGRTRIEVECLLALTGGVESDAAAIAALLGRDRSSVARVLHRLDRRLLVLNSRQEAPGRRRLYRLTDASAKLADRVRDRAMQRVVDMPNYDEFLALSTRHPREDTATGSGPSPVRILLPSGATGHQMTAMRLAACRRATGWTQRELATQAGVSLRLLQRMEAGRDDQPVHALRRCAFALGVRLADLLGS